MARLAVDLMLGTEQANLAGIGFAIAVLVVEPDGVGTLVRLVELRGGWQRPSKRVVARTEGSLRRVDGIREVGASWRRN